MMQYPNGFNYPTTIITARVLNALAFGTSLTLFYPLIQTNRAYGVLGLAVAVGMLWLTTFLTRNLEHYQARGRLIHGAIVLGLIGVGFLLGYSSLQLLGGSLIWSLVGVIDGAWRLRRQAKSLA